MIQGYERKPSKFDWCGTSVWLLKLTQADHESVFKEGNKGLFIDVVLRAVTDEHGKPLFTDKQQAEAFFRDVAIDDFTALGKLALRHSGYPIDDEPQKKS